MRLPLFCRFARPQAEHRPHPLWMAMALALSGAAHASNSGVVISQVYGAGGNNGALLANDYVELFNAGASTVDLTGWSIQYASTTGTSWTSKTTLGSVTLQPGQYLLIKESGGATGAALPTADLTGTIAMAAGAGKVALVTNNTTLTGAAPTGVEDILSYGPGSTPTEGAPTATLSTALAAWRLGGGCTDTNNNSADFITAAPAPRNSASALAPCTASPAPGPTPPSTPIHDIQGSGPTSPLLKQTVTTSGIVTKLSNNGFYLQDPNADGNPLTSEGIFVFTSTAPAVAVGQAITLSAKVAEFNTGAATNTRTLTHTVTELTSPTNITVHSSGNSIAPTVITLPATEAQLEAVEGMLVAINTQLTASQNYFQGRYGQVTLSANGRLEKPTNKFRPGTVDAINMAQGNAQRQILLDDGTSVQNPNPTPYIGADNTLRAGDTVDSLTGVIDYGLATSDNAGLASYKIHPTTAVSFTRTNARTTAPDHVGGNLRVASANVLNFFTTFSDGSTASGQTGQGCAPSGTTADCRGADSAAEFTRQRTKLLAELTALNADVVGLMELQNNAAAVQNLVDGLNSIMGAGTYAIVPDPASGVGTDAIKVGLIYKPAMVSRVGASTSDTAPAHKRPSVAQVFAAANGEKFAVIVNHFKSKGCAGASGADLDQNDGQGCFNAERLAEAQAIRAFVSTLQTNTGVDRALLLGDLNAYGQEDAVFDLTSNGYTDLAARFNTQAYSYVFDGEAGAIDHAVATPSLNSLVTGAAEWHVNADEPSVIDYNLEFKQPACASCGPDYYSPTAYRSSDHDPLVLGLNLVKAITGTSASEAIMGTPGDDRITGGAGADTVTGGAGRDVFVYTSIRDALDTITDFTPGQDRLDLSAIANALRATQGSQVDLLGGGFIQLTDTAAGLEVRIDSDGFAGSASARVLVRLQGVGKAQVQTSRDLML